MNHQEDRFAFGRNWQAFLSTLDQDRISKSMASLSAMLGVDSLQGKSFLDIGSGSGLSSLAAYRLGASVTSVDFDDDSVRCTEEIRQRYTDGSASWHVSQGSVLDESFMKSLGSFDVVYAWGVLHHTGEMHRAIEIAADRVAVDGVFFVAIYNDQGGASRRWLWIKRMYHRVPKFLRPLWVITVATWYECKFAAARLLRGKNPLPLQDWKAKRSDRGMSAWHDWVDWVGGLPFEVATPEQIILPLTPSRVRRSKTYGRSAAVGGATSTFFVARLRSWINASRFLGERMCFFFSFPQARDALRVPVRCGDSPSFRYE